MSLLGDAITDGYIQGGMTRKQLADRLIAEHFTAPGFTTSDELDTRLKRLEDGELWSLGDDSQRPFADCIGKILGPKAGQKVLIGLADDHNRRILGEGDPSGFP